MAGSKVNNYGVGDVDLTALMDSTDVQRKGYVGLSITNFDNDSEPAIAIGSKIEVNGALFEFDSEEAIGGAPADGIIYIKTIPAGASITAEFTATAPTWDDSKQGWYGTVASATHRYLPYRMILDTGDYKEKIELSEKKSEIMFNREAIIEEYIAAEDTTVNAAYEDVAPVLSAELVVTRGDIVRVIYYCETKGGTTVQEQLIEVGSATIGLIPTVGTIFATGVATIGDVGHSTGAYVSRYAMSHFLILVGGILKFKEQFKRAAGTGYIQNRYIQMEIINKNTGGFPAYVG